MAGRPRTRAKAGGRAPGVKNKPRAELLEFIKRELRSRHLLTWSEDWCPVARMAVLAEKALLNNDPYLALAALKEVARYTRAPLQAEPAKDPDDDPRSDVDMREVANKFFRLSRVTIEEKSPENEVLNLIPSSSEVVNVRKPE